MGGCGRSERVGGVPVHERRRLHHVAGHLGGRWLHGQRLDDLTSMAVGVGSATMPEGGRFLQ